MKRSYREVFVFAGVIALLSASAAAQDHPTRPSGVPSVVVPLVGEIVGPDITPLIRPDRELTDRILRIERRVQESRASAKRPAYYLNYSPESDRLIKQLLHRRELGAIRDIYIVTNGPEEVVRFARLAFAKRNPIRWLSTNQLGNLKNLAKAILIGNPESFLEMRDSLWRLSSQGTRFAHVDPSSGGFFVSALSKSLPSSHSYMNFDRTISGLQKATKEYVDLGSYAMFAVDARTLTNEIGALKKTDLREIRRLVLAGWNEEEIMDRYWADPRFEKLRPSTKAKFQGLISGVIRSVDHFEPKPPAPTSFRPLLSMRREDMKYLEWRVPFDSPAAANWRRQIERPDEEGGTYGRIKPLREGTRKFRRTFFDGDKERKFEMVVQPDPMNPGRYTVYTDSEKNLSIEAMIEKSYWVEFLRLLAETGRWDLLNSANHSSPEEFAKFVNAANSFIDLEREDLVEKFWRMGRTEEIFVGDRLPTQIRERLLSKGEHWKPIYPFLTGAPPSKSDRLSSVTAEGPERIEYHSPFDLLMEQRRQFLNEQLGKHPSESSGIVARIFSPRPRLHSAPPPRKALFMSESKETLREGETFLVTASAVVDLFYNQGSPAIYDRNAIPIVRLLSDLPKSLTRDGLFGIQLGTDVEVFDYDGYRDRESDIKKVEQVGDRLQRFLDDRPSKSFFKFFDRLPWFPLDLADAGWRNYGAYRIDGEYYLLPHIHTSLSGYTPEVQKELQKALSVPFSPENARSVREEMATYGNQGALLHLMEESLASEHRWNGIIPDERDDLGTKLAFLPEKLAAQMLQRASLEAVDSAVAKKALRSAAGIFSGLIKSNAAFFNDDIRGRVRYFVESIGHRTGQKIAPSADAVELGRRYPKLTPTKIEIVEASPGETRGSDARQSPVPRLPPTGNGKVIVHPSSRLNGSTNPPSRGPRARIGTAGENAGSLTLGSLALEIFDETETELKPDPAKQKGGTLPVAGKGFDPPKRERSSQADPVEFIFILGQGNIANVGFFEALEYAAEKQNVRIVIADRKPLRCSSSQIEYLHVDEPWNPKQVLTALAGYIQRTGNKLRAVDTIVEDYVFSRAEVMETYGKEYSLRGLDRETTWNTRYKPTMLALWKKDGLLPPDFEFDSFHSIEETEPYIRELLDKGKSCVIKPTLASSSLGVRLLDPEMGDAQVRQILAEVRDAVDRDTGFHFPVDVPVPGNIPGQKPHRWLVVEYVPSKKEVMIDALTFQIGNKVRTRSAEPIGKAPMERDFTEHLFLATTSLPDSQTEKNMTEIHRRALAALGISTPGPFPKWSSTHTELRITEDGKIFPIEVASRPGGGVLPEVHRLTTGHDVYRAGLTAALGQNPVHHYSAKRGAKKKSAAVRMIYAPKRGTLNSVDWKDVGGAQFYPRMETPGKIENPLSNVVGYLVSLDKSPQVALEKVESETAKLKLHVETAPGTEEPLLPAPAPVRFLPLEEWREAPVKVPARRAAVVLGRHGMGAFISRDGFFITTPEAFTGYFREHKKAAIELLPFHFVNESAARQRTSRWFPIACVSGCSPESRTGFVLLKVDLPERLRRVHFLPIDVQPYPLDTAIEVLAPAEKWVNDLKPNLYESLEIIPTTGGYMLSDLLATNGRHISTGIVRLYTPIRPVGAAIIRNDKLVGLVSGMNENILVGTSAFAWEIESGVASFVRRHQDAQESAADLKLAWSEIQRTHPFSFEAIDPEYGVARRFAARTGKELAGYLLSSISREIDAGAPPSPVWLEQTIRKALEKEGSGTHLIDPTFTRRAARIIEAIAASDGFQEHDERLKRIRKFLSKKSVDRAEAVKSSAPATAIDILAELKTQGTEKGKESAAHSLPPLDVKSGETVVADPEEKLPNPGNADRDRPPDVRNSFLPSFTGETRTEIRSGVPTYSIGLCVGCEGSTYGSLALQSVRVVDEERGTPNRALRSLPSQTGHKPALRQPLSSSDYSAQNDSPYLLIVSLDSPPPSSRGNPTAYTLPASENGDIKPYVVHRRGLGAFYTAALLKKEHPNDVELLILRDGDPPAERGALIDSVCRELGIERDLIGGLFPVEELRRKIRPARSGLVIASHDRVQSAKSLGLPMMELYKADSISFEEVGFLRQLARSGHPAWQKLAGKLNHFNTELESKLRKKYHWAKAFASSEDLKKVPGWWNQTIDGKSDSLTLAEWLEAKYHTHTLFEWVLTLRSHVPSVSETDIIKLAHEAMGIETAERRTAKPTFGLSISDLIKEQFWKHPIPRIADETGVSPLRVLNIIEKMRPELRPANSMRPADVFRRTRRTKKIFPSDMNIIENDFEILPIPELARKLSLDESQVISILKLRKALMRTVPILGSRPLNRGGKSGGALKELRVQAPPAAEAAGRPEGEMLRDPNKMRRRGQKKPTINEELLARAIEKVPPSLRRNPLLAARWVLKIYRMEGAQLSDVVERIVQRRGTPPNGATSLGANSAPAPAQPAIVDAPHETDKVKASQPPKDPAPRASISRTTRKSSRPPTEGTGALDPDVVGYAEVRLNPPVPVADSAGGVKRQGPDDKKNPKGVSVTDLAEWKKSHLVHPKVVNAGVASPERNPIPVGPKAPELRSPIIPPHRSPMASSPLVSGAIHYGIPKITADLLWKGTDIVLDGRLKELGRFQTWSELSQKMPEYLPGVGQEYLELHLAGTAADASLLGAHSALRSLFPSLEPLGSLGIHGNIYGRTAGMFLVLSAIGAAHGGQPFKDLKTVSHSAGQIMAFQESLTFLAKFSKLSPAVRQMALSGRLPLLTLAEEVGAVSLSHPAFLAVGVGVFVLLEGSHRFIEYYFLTKPTKEALLTEAAEAVERFQEVLFTNETLSSASPGKDVEVASSAERLLAALTAHFLYDEQKLDAIRTQEYQRLDESHPTREQRIVQGAAIERRYRDRLRAFWAEEARRKKPLPEILPLSLIQPVDEVNAPLCRSGQCIETFKEQLARLHPTSDQVPELLAKITAPLLLAAQQHWERRGYPIQTAVNVVGNSDK
ncbi:MAG TPA: ATP-grasp domain-containing protein [Bdellovibrionota bacterium]|nr:ATP-grasp domain-containing protein [Bdellovibrionota bacterium]